MPSPGSQISRGSNVVGATLPCVADLRFCCSATYLSFDELLTEKDISMTAITFLPVKSAGSRWRHFTGALRAIFAASQQQRVARELARFSERELADLGLTRGDIPAVARGERRR
jgi:uncharacterized protein YjiS (DUF1127 family)